MSVMEFRNPGSALKANAGGNLADQLTLGRGAADHRPPIIAHYLSLARRRKWLIIGSIGAALLIGLSWAFVRLPGGFLPVDDQGFITTDVQTPSDSSYARTEAAVERVEKYLSERAGVENVTFLTGFSFLGQGLNTAQAFITLKDWSERGPKDSASAIVSDINRDLSSIRDAKISALQPPPIDNLGNSSGFSFRLQDRGRICRKGR